MIEELERRNLLTTINPFVVTNTSDSGFGSLRQVLLNVNAATGPARITFDITSFGEMVSAPQTIFVQSALPIVTNSVIIDATTQPGYAGTPVVEVDGSEAGDPDGLVLQGGASTVIGLAIGNFNGNGIVIQTNGGDTVQGDNLGTDTTGSIAQPNSGDGLKIDGTSNNTIGGTTAATRNVISGNTGYGLVIDGTNGTASGNVIAGNYIGTDATGSTAQGRRHLRRRRCPKHDRRHRTGGGQRHLRQQRQRRSSDE